jgi:hypothetical protein
VRFSRVLISFVILYSVASAASRKSVYRNRDYGIFLRVPSEAWLCPTEGNGIDHGPALLLGSEDASVCRSWSRQKRWISIFGAVNAVEATKTLHTFLNSFCADAPLDWHEPGAVCSSAPANLSVSGLPSEAARINHSNGTIEIIVVTQAGKPDPDFDASVPSYNYSLSLFTDARHLEADLAVFRAVLKAVKLAPPPLAMYGQGPTDGGWPRSQ